MCHQQLWETLNSFDPNDPLVSFRRWKPWFAVFVRFCPGGRSHRGRSFSSDGLRPSAFRLRCWDCQEEIPTGSSDLSCKGQTQTLLKEKLWCSAASAGAGTSSNACLAVSWKVAGRTSCVWQCRIHHWGTISFSVCFVFSAEPQTIQLLVVFAVVGGCSERKTLLHRALTRLSDTFLYSLFKGGKRLTCILSNVRKFPLVKHQIKQLIRCFSASNINILSSYEPLWEVNPNCNK